MKIEFDPEKIKMEIIEKDERGNLVVVETEKTLADHYKECSGCAFCD